MTFIERARVYEVPVPVDSFTGLTVGLALSLDQHVPALANLGLLEIGTDEGRAVYRVSPLVKPAFDAADCERWHGVAAEYWWTAAVQGDSWSAPGVLQAWEHALAAKRQDIADQAADLLSHWLDGRGTYAHGAALGARHVAAFPDSVAGLNWAGYARYLAGDPREGRRLLERAVVFASTTPAEAGRRSRVTDSFARVLASLGEYPAAAHYFAELVAVEEGLHPDGSVNLGLCLQSLSGVFHDQGDLAGARACLERSLSIWHKIYGVEEHRDVARSLHGLAGVLFAQGDLTGARARFERSLEITLKIHGTEEHRDVATALHALAGVLFAQGDLAGARARLERSLEIMLKIHGTEEHPDVAVSLHALGGVLYAQRDMAGARARLERSLEITQGIHGTEDHPNFAASLHELALVLLAEGDLAGARARLERSLEITQKIHGTEDHPAVASSLHALAGVLGAQGDLTGAHARFGRSLEITQKIHGTEDHPSVAASLHALAGVLLAQDDMAGARARFERSLEIQQKVHGTEDHPNVAATYAGLGECLRDLKLFDESERAFRTALRIRERIFGTCDAMYAETEFTLAKLLVQRGRPDEARDLVRHVVAVLQAQVPNHPILAMLRAAATQQAPSE